MDFVDIADYSKFLPKKLSGGLLRRLNIACGIAHKPKLIFFDEPTVAVDPQSRNKILEGIKKLNRDGATIIYTSHYMEEVEQLCDRILIMDKGKALALGTKDELKRMIKNTETINVEIADLSEAQLDALKQLHNAYQVSFENGQLRIYFSGGRHNIIHVLDYLEQNNLSFGQVYTQLPTLNDVFLEITGKELRINEWTKIIFSQLKIHHAKHVPPEVTLFWTLAFPLLLATFMYMAFGNLFEKDEMFKTINVAVVESENDDTLMSVLESLDVNHTDSASKSDDKVDSSNSFSDLINMKLMDSSAAKKALNDKKVTGIIYTKDASLVVDENSYNATILESILTQYKQQKDVFTNIAKTNPAALETAIAGLSETASEYKEISLSSGNQDEYTNYFYAVFAMSCLFASFSAVSSTCRLLADTSPLGMRKSLVPACKNTLIFSEYISLLSIHFAVELIALAYMTLLGVDLEINIRQSS